MKTRDMIITALLLAVGLVLHTITPPVFGGIKPDFLLSCMFLAIVINKGSANALSAGVVAGLMSAMTTGFPGGQIPNVLDKITTSIIVYAMVRYVFKNNMTNLKLIFLSIVGTLISGTLFLTFAALIAGLPAPFMTLFVAAVLPATALNAVASLLIYRAFLSVKVGKQTV